MQECILFETEVNECGPDAGNYLSDFTEVNIADVSFLIGIIQEKFSKTAVLGDCNSDLFAYCVD